MLSDHGQTQGATFKQRNGYGLDDLVERSLERGQVATVRGGDENHSNLGNAVGEATVGTAKKKRPKNDVSDKEVVVLGSGNLGLVYLMERATALDQGGDRRPASAPAAGAPSHPHVGWLLVHSERDGPLVLGAHGTLHLADGSVEGQNPLAGFSPNAPQHLLRTDGFEHVADIMVGSFYDPTLDEGCAFEELISFHGGIGGAQTRPFLLAPVELPLPEEPIVGASAVHAILSGWRRTLNDGDGPVEPRTLASTTP